MICAVPRCRQPAVTVFCGFALCERCLLVAYDGTPKNHKEPSMESKEVDRVLRAHGAIAVLSHIRWKAGISNSGA